MSLNFLLRNFVSSHVILGVLSICLKADQKHFKKEENNIYFAEELDSGFNIFMYL